MLLDTGLFPTKWHSVFPFLSFFLFRELFLFLFLFSFFSGWGCGPCAAFGSCRRPRRPAARVLVWQTCSDARRPIVCRLLAMLLHLSSLPSVFFKVSCLFPVAPLLRGPCFRRETGRRRRFRSATGARRLSNSTSTSSTSSQLLGPRRRPTPRWLAKQ